MKLDPETIRKLARLTLETRPEEISCEDWIHRVGEYVESARRAEGELDDRLLVVERHAADCPHCAEELAALRALLTDEDDAE